MGSVITGPSQHLETESTRLVELWQGQAGRREKEKRKEGRFPCFVWKGFPDFLARLRMRPVSGGNSRLAMCEVPRAERPR